MSHNQTQAQNLQNLITQINSKRLKAKQFQSPFNNTRQSNNQSDLHIVSSHQEDKPFLNITKLNQLNANNSSRQFTHGIRRRKLPVKKQKTQIKEKRVANKQLNRYPHGHQFVIDFKLFSDELQCKIQNKAKRLQQTKKKTQHLENYYNNLVLEYIKDNKQKEKNNLKHIFVYKTNNNNKIIQIEYQKKKPKKIAPITAPVYSKEDKSYHFRMLDTKQKKKYSSKQLIDVDQILSNEIMITPKPFTSVIKNRKIIGSPLGIERKSQMIQNLNTKKIKYKQRNFSILDDSKFRQNLKKKISDFKVEGWEKEDKDQELFNSYI